MYEINDQSLQELVNRFYDKVRRDSEIGPVFNGAVHDWPAHLQTLGAFWSSVMLKSGTYKGNPMAVHIKHASQISMPMFDRWLGLWRETTEEMFAPQDAGQLQDRAQRIAQSLRYGLDFYRSQLDAAAPIQH